MKWCNPKGTTYVFDLNTYTFNDCLTTTFIQTSPFAYLLLWKSWRIALDHKSTRDLRHQLPNRIVAWLSLMDSLYSLLTFYRMKTSEGAYYYDMVYFAVVTLVQKLYTFGILHHSRQNGWKQLQKLYFMDGLLQTFMIARPQFTAGSSSTLPILVHLMTLFLQAFIPELIFDIVPSRAFQPSRINEKVCWFSTMLYSSVFPLLNYGYQTQKLGFQDLPKSRIQDNPRLLNLEFDKKWKKTPDPSLIWTLLSVCRSTFIWSGIHRLFSDIGKLFIPFFLNKMLQFLASNDPEINANGYGYFLAFGLFFSLMIKSLCEHRFWILGKLPTRTPTGIKQVAKVFWIGTRCGMHIRSILWNQVYAKVFRLSITARGLYPSGKMQTLLAVDASSTCDNYTVCSLHWGTWSSLLTLVVSLYAIAYYLSTLSCIVWLVLTVSALPCGIFLTHRIKTLKQRLQKARDARMNQIQSASQMILSIRSLGWQYWILKLIRELRQIELQLLEQIQKTNANINTSVWITQLIGPVAGLLTFTIVEGQPLDSATAFTSIAWFSTCSEFLWRIPGVIDQLSSAYISLNRLQEFLLSEETNVEVLAYNPLLPGEIQIQAQTIKWQQHQSPILTLPDLTITPHGLVVVVAPVGFGKTTLLSMLLGNTCDALQKTQLAGSIAYCAQDAWLMSGTIRENILFGKAYDRQKYAKVIYACALVDDISEFEQGDLTLVGNDGNLLSGGQRQRVAIARAAYAEADIVLLDDVLCNVDERVRQHISKECIGKLLRHSTCIFASTSPNLLQHLENVTMRLSIDEHGYVSVQEHFPEAPKSLLSPQRSTHLDETTDRSVDTTAADTHGSFSWSLLQRYLSAFGESKAYRLFLAVLFIAGPVLHVSNTQFLAKWCGEFASSSPSYVFLYAHIAGTLTECLIFMVRIFSFIRGAVAASASFHEMFTKTIFITAPMCFLDNLSCGELTNRFLTDIIRCDEQIPGALKYTTRNVLMLCATFSAILLTSYAIEQILVLFLVSAIPYVWIFHFYRWPARDLQRLDLKSREPILQFFDQSLKGVHTFRAFGEHTIQHYRSLLLERIEVASQSFWISWECNQWVTVWLELIGMFMVLGCSMVNIIAHTSRLPHPNLLGLSPSNSLGITLLFAIRIPNQIGWAIKNLASCEIQFIALERIFAIHGRANELNARLRGHIPDRLTICTSVPEKQRALLDLSASKGKLQLAHVYMSYDNLANDADTASSLLKQWVLQDITLEIPAGQQVAIVGRTGSGKTTLCHILLGHYPYTGTIHLDNHLLHQTSDDHICADIAYIDQFPRLVGRTIRETLVGGEAHVISDAEIWQVLEAIEMESKIKSLPQGLDSCLVHDASQADTTAPIIEVTQCFSCGEIQLLAIARALLSNPNCRIFLCDEINASLDEQTDARIYAILSKLSCTIISVVHQLRHLKSYDLVVVLDHGKVAEVGAPVELLRNRESHLYQLATAASSLEL